MMAHGLHPKGISFRAPSVNIVYIAEFTSYDVLQLNPHNVHEKYRLITPLQPIPSLASTYLLQYPFQKARALFP